MFLAALRGGGHHQAMRAKWSRLLPLLLVAAILPFAACGGDDDSGGKSFSEAGQVTKPGKQYTATMRTSEGVIVVELYADIAPETVNSFVFLAQEKFFDGVTFHRVVTGFVIQSGDPTGSGSGGPGYSTDDEPNQRPNKRGTLAMAKAAGADDFGSQFFINLADNASLDYNNQAGDKFYPFGEVVSGMDAVDAIGASPVDANGKPNPPVILEQVTIEEK
jgi:cyclophilin family peptidyl-prolyl cis-trans isomerase